MTPELDKFLRRPRVVYSASNAMVQSENAARMGFIGHTEVDGDRIAAYRAGKLHWSNLTRAEKDYCGRTK